MADIGNLFTAKNIGFMLGPALFVSFVFIKPLGWLSMEANQVIGIALWMITWWISEAAPIPVTALLPIVLFSLLRIMPVADATAPYANQVIFLFMGGFIIALALEKHKLHERIALNIIKLTGTSGNGIILGFMIATAFLSMWISNTAAAIMMLPIAISVIDLLKKIPSAHQVAEKQQRNFALGLMLSIAYAANIGGIATIIGTPPNVVFKGMYQEFYGGEIDFAMWMLLGLPVSLFLLINAYLFTTRLLFPNKMKSIPGANLLITEKLESLGKLRSTEIKVLVVFSLTAAAWILQQLINSLFDNNVLNDTNIAMAGGILMFIVPADLQKNEALLDWPSMKNLPWGILLLFGGGLCLAKGLESTGVIKWIGESIAGNSDLNIYLLIILLTSIMLFLTELMSNVALTTIFIPVVFGIADGLALNPALLAIPVTLAASCAFMFPISTPPNAIVFASGYIRMKDMIRAGILLNLSSVIIIVLISFTLLNWLIV
jgi:solute carrier family 13 (sodium-dependent dicarboxylate transporter), member 2/3/5